ncbi:DMT family transporter [Paenibacillus sp. PK4536]|uniref:DMT family transporter n=1 Tax=unclassified Paenibacillus TaxID=185978 RepID=UPI0010BFD4F1|nr:MULTISPECIES: DMT family transporter [unclassified Paenibacillus]TKJ88365.1 EamA family transporter [Paenibacillus sp. CFBP13512]WIM40859.1 DMT family transporter [Paenibacillus sp. PK4536]
MKPKELGALLLLGALWGASFIFIRIAAPVLGPIWLIDLRVWIAGIVLLIYALIVRKLPDFKKEWKYYLMLGLLNAAIPFSLIAYSAVHLNASLTAILNATTPLFTAIVARIWLKEYLSVRKVIGILIGLVGVCILMGWSSVPFTLEVWLSIGASLTAALFYGIGSVYTKLTFTNTPALSLSIGQQLAAGIILIPLSVVTVPTATISLTVMIAVLGLAVLCTAIGYLLYFYLVEHVGPTKTVSVTFLVPLFGIFWGILLLNEHITLGTIVGLIVIFIGVILMNGVQKTKKIRV